MRYLILAPLAVCAGLVLLSAGCSNSSKPTAPATNVQKSTQMDVGGGKGQGGAGRNPRTLE